MKAPIKTFEETSYAKNNKKIFAWLKKYGRKGEVYYFLIKTSRGKHKPIRFKYV